MSTKAERQRKIEPELVLSGQCAQARHQAGSGRLKAAASFHANCRGTWFSTPGTPAKQCSCPCHRPKTVDIADVVRRAKRARQLAAGIDLEAPAPKILREKCRNEHEMTPENTGPSGDCRRCKRESSAKRRKKGST